MLSQARVPGVVPVFPEDVLQLYDVSVCVYIHIYIHTHTHTFSLIHTITHACMHACIHACIHTYTHTHTQISHPQRDCCICLRAYVCTDLYQVRAGIGMFWMSSPCSLCPKPSSLLKFAILQAAGFPQCPEHCSDRHCFRDGVM